MGNWVCAESLGEEGRLDLFPCGVFVRKEERSEEKFVGTPPYINHRENDTAEQVAGADGYADQPPSVQKQGPINFRKEKDEVVANGLELGDSSGASTAVLPSGSRTPNKTSTTSDKEDGRSVVEEDACVSPEAAVAMAGSSASVSSVSLAELEERPPTNLGGGVLYTGQWRGDVKEGFGRLSRPDGSEYIGEFKDDRAQGEGTFRHSSGDVYEGQWLHDQACGFGTFKHADGSSYRGQWKDDLQQGYGIERWTDGSSFQGNYVASKKQGAGKFYWAEGSVYEGQFYDNEIHGYGHYVWTDGRQYTGQWRFNHMHGSGEMTWLDGRSYRGEYKEDKKDGEGEFIWHDGRKYKGEWKEGRQHGLGKYTNAKGTERAGEWKEGKRIRWLSEDEEEDYKVMVEKRPQPVETEAGQVPQNRVQEDDPNTSTGTSCMMTTEMKDAVASTKGSITTTNHSTPNTTTNKYNNDVTTNGKKTELTDDERFVVVLRPGNIADPPLGIMTTEDDEDDKPSPVLPDTSCCTTDNSAKNHHRTGSLFHKKTTPSQGKCSESGSSHASDPEIGASRKSGQGRVLFHFGRKRKGVAVV